MLIQEYNPKKQSKFNGVDPELIVENINHASTFYNY